MHCFIVFRKDVEVPAKKHEKKASAVKKRKNDDISQDTVTISQNREFVVSVPRKEIPVEILVPKKQKKDSESSPDNSNDEGEFTMEEKNEESA